MEKNIGIEVPKVFKNERNDIEIGRNKYESLKEKLKKFNVYNFANPDLKPKYLTDLELNQMKNFENQKIFFEKEAKEKSDLYLKNLRNGTLPKIERIQGLIPDKSNFYHGFIQAFEFLNKKKFELNPDSILNLEAVVKYFARDESFKNSERLIKKIDNRELTPSFKKGILIVGDFGNGKSSIIQTFEYLINHNFKIANDKHWHNVHEWNELRFKFIACRAVASEYEFIKNDDGKRQFSKKYKSFNYCFDDFLKEQNANNYGVKNTIQVILEDRYDDIFDKITKGKKVNRTHGTVNYNNDYPGDLKIAIQSFGLKYQPHIYDRVLEMFNIIEFKGKSFRK